VRVTVRRRTGWLPVLIRRARPRRPTRGEGPSCRPAKKRALSPLSPCLSCRTAHTLSGNSPPQLSPPSMCCSWLRTIVSLPVFFLPNMVHRWAAIMVRVSLCPSRAFRVPPRLSGPLGGSGRRSAPAGEEAALRGLSLVSGCDDVGWIACLPRCVFVAWPWTSTSRPCPLVCVALETDIDGPPFAAINDDRPQGSPRRSLKHACMAHSFQHIRTMSAGL